MKKLQKIKGFLINLALMLFVIFIFFIFFEIFLRVTSPKPKYERANEFIFYEYDECLGWKNKANASGIFYMPDTQSYVTINSHGLRDFEHNYNKSFKKTGFKKISVKRIEFFGDSFTWGYGLDAGKRYTDIFAEKLQENYSNEFEIINFGTTGYATDQEYLFLKKEGIRYNPDIVVFAYHNDAFEVSRKNVHSYNKPFFLIQNNSLVLTNYPVPKRDRNWTDRFDVVEGNFIIFFDSKMSLLKSYVFLKDRLLILKLFSNLKNKMFLKNMDNTLKVIDKLLLESKKATEKNNATFIILILPDKYQVYGNANTLEINHILNFSEKENISVINLLPQLKDIGKKQKDMFFIIDQHYSEKGNEIVGELLYKEMERRFIDNVK